MWDYSIRKQAVRGERRGSAGRGERESKALEGELREEPPRPREQAGVAVWPAARAQRRRRPVLSQQECGCTGSIRRSCCWPTCRRADTNRPDGRKNTGKAETLPALLLLAKVLVHCDG